MEDPKPEVPLPTITQWIDAYVNAGKDFDEKHKRAQEVCEMLCGHDFYELIRCKVH